MAHIVGHALYTLNGLGGNEAMTGREQSERRKDERLDERFRVSFRQIRDGAPSGKTVATKTLNLSASGLCLISPEPLDPEHHLALELSLQGQEEELIAIGRVVWCDREDDGFRVGICFTWLREEDRDSLKIIADYVQARIGS